MKKNSFFAVLFLSAILISGNAYAWGRGCPHDESEGHGGRSTDLHEKYFHKVSFLMAHRRELALTEPQVDSILDKKNQVMRAMVEARAQEEAKRAREADARAQAEAERASAAHALVQELEEKLRKLQEKNTDPAS